MADSFHAGTPGATPFAPAPAIPKPLREVALEATYELEALLQTVARHLPLPCVEAEFYAIRGMALRAAQLNDVVMAVLGDTEACDVKELDQCVFGRITGQQRAADRAKEVSHG